MAGRTERTGPGSEIILGVGGASNNVEYPKEPPLEGEGPSDATAGTDITPGQGPSNNQKCASDDLFGRTVYLRANKDNIKGSIDARPEAYSIAEIISGDAFSKHLDISLDRPGRKWPPLPIYLSGRYHWIHLPLNDFETVKVRKFEVIIATTDLRFKAHRKHS